MVKREGEPEAQTRLKMLQFLRCGSPKLRYILSQPRGSVLLLSAGDKLLITEDTPLVTWYLELVYRFVYVVLKAEKLGSNAGLHGQFPKMGVCPTQHGPA